MTDITFSSKAYCKIILHAAKYPYAAVNGVLLAKTPVKGKEIEFVDAVPLFHIALNLTPMAEIALTQIDQVASQAGLTIAGYYTAHENLWDCSFERAQHRIADKIAENCPNACLVVIDNSKLSMQLDNLAIRVAQFSDGKYREVNIQKVSLNTDETLDICSALIESRDFEELVDFDNHLDDVSKDWMNDSLNKKIEMFNN
ncbi:PREDICTED: ER membrane protein complex subunit 8/9 homolog [Nicrophorus vespilloides]|uniref:ER membrane protein complex subunit 8/9 homolog n=1 Tax=Nicrophorus vespilloides TaxID=110193 RepID=A0ABM1N0I9_NICVS|nr:PREDICTED: ER membrane protein complex subunit 8/9 homolog [Nicrophorus vespilloides]